MMINLDALIIFLSGFGKRKKQGTLEKLWHEKINGKKEKERGCSHPIKAAAYLRPSKAHLHRENNHDLNRGEHEKGTT